MSVAPVLTTAPSRTPRQILREWLQTVTGESDQYDVAELSARAVRRFDDDSEMKAACLAYAVQDLMPQVAAAEFRRGRENARRDIEDAVARKLATWYEHIGDTTHKRLLEMTRPELRFASEQREARAAGELRAAGFLRDLDSGLKSTKQTVRQRYDDAEITTVWRRHYDTPELPSAPLLEPRLATP